VLTPCKHTSRQKKNCKCAIWVQGPLGGEYSRKSLDIRSCKAASDLVRGCATSGELGLVKVDIPELDEAVNLYLADCKHAISPRKPSARTRPSSSAGSSVGKAQGLHPAEATRDRTRGSPAWRRR
jgi:hypothetical protein